MTSQVSIVWGCKSVSGRVLRRVALTLTVVLVLVGFVHVASAQATDGMTTVDCTTDSLTTGWFTIEDATHTVTTNYGCAGDAVIPSGVTTIGDDAFSDASSLVTVTIPYSVTSIGQDVFTSTTSLTGISVDGKNANYKSSDGVLFTKAGDVVMRYPSGNTRTSYTIPNGVTSIGIAAFNGVSSLASVVIPNGVTTLKERAFASATGLTSITFPSSVGEIGNDAFDGTSNLTSLFFEGNAPVAPGDTFDYGPPNETFYHFSNATGFTAVPWDGLILALYLPVPPVPTAIAGVGSATISVQAAAIGPPPTSFTITSNPGAATCTVTGASGSCTISGLTIGTSYTFTTVAHEGPTNSAVSAESTAVVPTAVVPTALKPPSAPGHIAWHIPHLVSQKLVASFPTAGSTTYTIFGTLQSSKRLHPRAHTTARGTCRVTTNTTTQTSTAKCTIRFSRSGTWLIKITPTQSGLVGIPTTKIVKIDAPRPARKPQPAEPITG